MEVLIVYIVMDEWRSYVVRTMRDFYDERRNALCPDVCATAKGAVKEVVFHDAKIPFHIVKNAIAQHHESISFSEISFRIAKTDN